MFDKSYEIFHFHILNSKYKLYKHKLNFYIQNNNIDRISQTQSKKWDHLLHKYAVIKNDNIIPHINQWC